MNVLAQEGSAQHLAARAVRPEQAEVAFPHLVLGVLALAIAGLLQSSRVACALEAMHAQHVVGDVVVDLGVRAVQRNEQKIETRQQRVGQADVIRWRARRVVLQSEVRVRTNMHNGDSESVHTCPNTGLAAASTEQRAFRVVCTPAF